jgi:hypothetical protein
MKLNFLNNISDGIKKKFFFITSLSIYFLIDKKFSEDNYRKFAKEKNFYKNSLNNDHFNRLFLKKDIILGNEMKKYINLSTPFNRKTKYIYDLPFTYPEYENYNFNKLSDFFLNIHIFIN